MTGTLSKKCVCERESPTTKSHPKDPAYMSLLQNHGPLEQLPISSSVFWHFDFCTSEVPTCFFSTFTSQLQLNLHCLLANKITFLKWRKETNKNHMPNRNPLLKPPSNVFTSSEPVREQSQLQLKTYSSWLRMMTWIMTIQFFNRLFFFITFSLITG